MKKFVLFVFVLFVFVSGCTAEPEKDTAVVVETVAPAPVPTAVLIPYRLPADWKDVPVRAGRAVGRQLVMSVPDEWETGDMGGMMQYEYDGAAVTVFPASAIPANETDEEHLHRLSRVMQGNSYDYGLTRSSVETIGNNVVYVLEYDVRTAAGSHLVERVYMEVFMPDGRGVALWGEVRRSNMTNKDVLMFLEIAESVRWSEPLRQGV